MVQGSEHGDTHKMKSILYQANDENFDNHCSFGKRYFRIESFGMSYDIVIL